MGFFKQIATPLQQRNIPVIPLRECSKIAFLDEWEQKATIDAGQIDEWDKEFPNANCASVALAKEGGFWFLELDSKEAIKRINDETGMKFPTTFVVRSSPERGHFYFQQTPASMAMGNIAQGFVKHSDWSARIDRQYVVSPGSIHPKTLRPYEICSTAPIIKAPQWLLDWCNSQRVEKKTAEPAGDTSVIAEGRRNDTLASHAGKLRNDGLEQDELLVHMLKYNEKRCVPPLPVEEVQSIVYSICRYPIGRDTRVIIGGKIGGVAATTTTSDELVHHQKTIPYPEFPEWALRGTSIYEGFCKPVCDVNCRYPEFMFMPAMVVMLNWLSTRVRILYRDFPLSMYLAVIGKKGRAIKSASVEDAFRYFEHAGITGYGSHNTKDAEGKTLIYSAGSTESVGINMEKSSCHNAMLFYDELAVLVSKAGIDGSSMSGHLLQCYESALFANSVKSGKDSFSIKPGTYCMSLIACTTDERFLELWAKLAGGSTGLDDRFFFLYQPQKFKPHQPMRSVSTVMAAMRTRELMDRAVAKGVYRILNEDRLAAHAREIGGNRAEIRAEKLALGFAVDLGLDDIDDDCIGRALAVIAYERAVKRYLHIFEANTQEGTLQMLTLDALRRSDNGLLKGEIEKIVRAQRYGTSVWKKAYQGLIDMGWTAVKGNRLVLTAAAPENDDETDE